MNFLKAAATAIVLGSLSVKSDDFDNAVENMMTSRRILGVALTYYDSVSLPYWHSARDGWCSSCSTTFHTCFHRPK